VSCLYLTPIFSSAAYHRYHTYDYLAVDPLLGGTDALRALILDRITSHPAVRGTQTQLVFEHLPGAGLLTG